MSFENSLCVKNIHETSGGCPDEGGEAKAAYEKMRENNAFFNEVAGTNFSTGPASYIEQVPAEDEAGGSNQTQFQPRKPNAKAGEMEVFGMENLGAALKLMWDVSLSGTENAVEVNGYLVEDDAGNLSIVIFNHASLGNSIDGSNNPISGVNSNTGRKMWNGADIVAQIHTHPEATGRGYGSRTPSPRDVVLSKTKLRNIPVISLGANGVGVALNGKRNISKHSKAYFFRNNLALLEEYVIK